MKIVAIVLSLALACCVGFVFGRAQGVQAVQAVIVNSCDKLGGFAVVNKVYACERAKKEKKVD